MNERLITMIRMLLGLALLAFGANGLFHFLPMDSPPKAAVGSLSALNLLQLLCVTQLACGVLLVVNRLVPLALVCLAPVSANILCFNLARAPDVEAIAGYAVVVVNLLLLIAYRRHLTPILAYKSSPGDV